MGTGSKAGSGEIQLRLSCQWQLDKDVLATRFSAKRNGVTILTTNGATGWNAAKGDITGFRFDSAGRYSHGVWIRHGQQWHTELSHVQPDGRVILATTVFSDITPDSFTGQVQRVTQDGVRLPGTPQIHWHRDK